MWLRAMLSYLRTIALRRLRRPVHRHGRCGMITRSKQSGKLGQAQPIILFGPEEAELDLEEE